MYFTSARFALHRSIRISTLPKLLSALDLYSAESERQEQLYGTTDFFGRIALTGQIINDYAGIVWQLEQEYTHAGRQAWLVVQRTAPDLVRDVEPARFIEQFVHRARVRIPSPDNIRASFAYETNLMQIQFPALTETLAEEVPVTADQVAREQDRVAEQEPERMLANMNRAIVRDAQARKEQIVNSFLADVAVQTRNLCYDAVTDTLDLIRDE